MSRESAVMRDVQLELSRLDFNGKRAVSIHRRHIGLFIPLKSAYPIQIGETGQADWYGHMQNGRAVEIECKTLDHGSLSPAQRKWRDHCLGMNVLWFLARSGEFAKQEILRALRGDK